VTKKRPQFHSPDVIKGPSDEPAEQPAKPAQPATVQTEDDGTHVAAAQRVEDEVAREQKANAPAAAKSTEQPTEPRLQVAKSPDSSAPPATTLSREQPTYNEQLRVLANCEGGNMTVTEFAEACGLGEAARYYLDYLVASGLVSRHWAGSAGRYSITEAGRRELEA